MIVLALCAAAAPEFRLRDTTGIEHSFAEWQSHPAIVLFFVTTDCPVANSYVPEMNRIREAYASRGVLFFAVQAEAAVPQADVIRYAVEYGYRFPLLLDPAQVLVRLAGATVTPQAAVLSRAGKVLYLGRIDNRVADFGQVRFHATESDLREALDAILAGKPAPHPFTKSIGCAINRVPEESR
jgi:peroxiredoxin